MSALPRNLLFGIAVLSTLQGCAWYPQYLDNETDALRSQLSEARSELGRQAAPYRTGGKDFYLVTSSKPLRQTLEKFNSLSADDRTMTMVEIDAGGRIAEKWTDCPWPFSGRIGVYVSPLSLRYASGAIVSVGELEYAGWPAISGLQFRLKGVGAAGYVTLYGAAELCGLNSPIAPIFVALVGGTFDSRGKATVTVKPEGIGYELELVDPLWFIGNVYVGGLGGITIPFPLTPKLFDGTVSNMLGNEGKVQVGPLGKTRSYLLDLRFTEASFVDDGLGVGGNITITWK